MPNGRGVIAGFAAFLFACYLALAYEPPTLFVVGFCGGAVAGALAGDLRGGLWNGFLVGLAELLVVLGVLAWLVFGYDPQHAYPGIGYSMVLLSFLGLVYVVEATIAGGIAGSLR
jgi:hypothetical protein